MKKKRKKIVYVAAVFALGVTAVCLKPQTVVTASQQGRLETISSELVYEDTMELSYADQFQVDYYEGGYAQISIVDGDQFWWFRTGQKFRKIWMNRSPFCSSPFKIFILSQHLRWIFFGRLTE